MEPEGSLLFSQKPVIGPYPEPDESSPHLPTHFPKIYSNFMIPYKPSSSKWLLPFRFSNQNIVCISQLSHAC